MTRLYRNDMSANASADERDIADDVENFVPREFIGKTQRFLTQDSIAPNHNGVFQAASFDQVFLHQRRDFFVEDKSACGRDFAFVKRRRNLGGEKLGEAIVRSCLCTRNAKLLIGQEHEK